jgi:hypothetical protein
MSGGVSGSLALRLAAFALVIVFLQVGVISELPVFGVNADLSSLLVAFVGLMCGSSVGAACGFAVGLFIDLALLQTLGLTSLIFTLIGYWCGRLRELRDPQAARRLLADGVHARRRRTCQLRAAAPDRARDRRQRDRRIADVGADAPRPRGRPARGPPPPPAATHLHDRGPQSPFQAMSAAARAGAPA